MCIERMHAQVVGALGDMREDLADLQAALAMLGELERRHHQAAGLALGLDAGGRRLLAVVLRQIRLGVEGVDLRRAAVHEEMDELLRPAA